MSIRNKNKLRYLQGAPSVAMQEIPPDLEGWLTDEERKQEESDEERGGAVAGERRSDRSMACNEFFGKRGQGKARARPSAGAKEDEEETEEQLVVTTSRSTKLKRPQENGETPNQGSHKTGREG
ncbi:hypothetical protein DFH29DRAFT_1002323 [Suillus ampliporus]|nr:hypothetical protein DFH29DRAFT_1002323 [Suillus ampliporus]